MDAKKYVYVEFKDDFFPHKKGEKVFIKKTVLENEDYSLHTNVLPFPKTEKIEEENNTKKTK